MDHKQERVKELWSLGFSCHVIAKNLNEQGVFTSEIEVASILGLRISEKGVVMYQYKVDESKLTNKINELSKNRLYLIAELLSTGMKKSEVAKKVGMNNANLHRDVDKYIIIKR